MNKKFDIGLRDSGPFTKITLLFLSLILLNIVASRFYQRFDLTKEKRYSISKPSKEVIRGLDDLVYVKVYLEGDFPSGFVRLQNSVRDLLNEFKAIGGQRIRFEFINPLDVDDEEEKKAIFNELIAKGLSPTNLQVKASDAYEEKIIFPGALVYYRGRELPVTLLENQIGFAPEEVLNNSIINLEYKFVNTILKLKRQQPPHVLFLEGHGELNTLEVSDFTSTLNSLQYKVSRMNLKETFKIPDDVDLVICAKPNKVFDEKELFKLDQFVMRGGKMLWLVESVKADMDSLRNKQMFIATNEERNLENLLFKYGVRINYDLVQDMELCNPIPLILGNQTQLFPWYYFPLLVSEGDHPISKNLDPVATQFVSSIDTIRNKIDKTILLHSSRYSKAVMTPTRIHLGILREEPNPDLFNQSNIPAAVLLEGEFESFFKNYLAESFLQAIDTIDELEFNEKSDFNKMIVIADGDVIRNDLRSNGSIYPLGYYKYTEQTFANRDFLINCIEYLLDDSGIIESRTKELKIRLLDRVRIQKEKLMWQLINVVLPILLIAIFGVGFNYRRKRAYAG